MSDNNLKDVDLSVLMTRRELLIRGAAMAAAGTLGLPLAGCGGAGTSTADAIWGPGGAADQIQSSLAGITQAAMFPAVDFNVTAYGAQTITPVAYTSGINPFVDPAVSVVPQMVTLSQYGFTTGPLANGTPGSNQFANMSIPNAFDSRPAFTAAINACSAAGGGRVVVPPGNWYCGGPIVLKSNVNFHLSANCQIFFSPNPADYAKDGPYNCGANGNLFYSRWQGNDCLNYGSAIYAYNQTNIAVTGTDATSILNGQAMIPYASNGTNPAAPTRIDNTTALASCWWTMKGTGTVASLNYYGGWGFVSNTLTPGNQNAYNSANVDLATFTPVQAPNIYTNGTLNWLYTLLGTSTPGTVSSPGWTADNKYLPALAEAGVAPTSRIFGKGHYLPPPLIQFIGCNKVLFENYTTYQSPFWQHNPVNCTNVVVRGVFTSSLGPNNDGYNPDACNNVMIDNVTFNTGDDCIAMKSGKDGDIQYGPTQNVLVQNCNMNSGHGAITMGSEMMGGVQNVYARNLTFTNAYWNVNPLNIGIRFKTNMNRGGFIKNVYVNGISMPNGVMTVGKTDSTGINNPATATSPSPMSTSVALGVTNGTVGNPSTSQGGVITFDCDYAPSADPVRTRPPVVNNIQIQNITVGNVTPSSGTSGFNSAATYPASCFQAIVMQGPVAADYNGPLPAPTTYPITNVSITNCNFGTPVNPAVAVTPGTTPSAIYALGVNSAVLSNVTIGTTVLNKTITA